MLYTVQGEMLKCLKVALLLSYNKLLEYKFLTYKNSFYITKEMIVQAFTWLYNQGVFFLEGRILSF